MFICIGQKRVRRHAADKGELVRCTNESAAPSSAAHPEWGYLCQECSSAAPIGPPSLKEEFNASAMQCDFQELKDAAESGFRIGMYESDRVDGE